MRDGHTLLIVPENEIHIYTHRALADVIEAQLGEIEKRGVCVAKALDLHC